MDDEEEEEEEEDVVEKDDGAVVRADTERDCGRLECPEGGREGSVGDIK